MSLIEAWPALAAVVPAAEREMAERALRAPLLSACDEDLALTLAADIDGAFDFLVLNGIVLKETVLATRGALELLGPGDVLGPPLSALRQVESRAVSRYLAHGPVTLATLDGRFRLAARRWPELSLVLHDSLARQTHRASMHLAMLHLPRIEDRIVALFGDLAERFGRMTPAGAVIDLDLTHEVIGRLVASRRPTVTIALQALAEDGRLVRREDAAWVLQPGAVAP
ncbi:MAG TPA: Crp/Fnr family transcriptional regulator [Solirubrobacteraceae bacterium]